MKRPPCGGASLFRGREGRSGYPGRPSGIGALYTPWYLLGEGSEHTCAAPLLGANAGPATGHPCEAPAPYSDTGQGSIMRYRGAPGFLRKQESLWCVPASVDNCQRWLDYHSHPAHSLPRTWYGGEHVELYERVDCGRSCHSSCTSTSSV